MAVAVDDSIPPDRDNPVPMDICSITPEPAVDLPNILAVEMSCISAKDMDPGGYTVKFKSPLSYAFWMKGISEIRGVPGKF